MSRPENLEFPSIWLEFKAKDIDSDNLVTYRVQDLPIDRNEDAVQHMLTYFLKEEPWAVSMDFSSDPESIEEYSNILRYLLQQKTVLACFREGSDDIVGLNFLIISDGLHNKTPKSKCLSLVYNAAQFVSSKIDVLMKYGIDKYMTSLSLSVHPKYRNRGISTWILKSRIPFGKAIGVTLTATVFTAIASQKASHKAGFKVEHKISYEDMGKAGFNFSNVDSKYCEYSSMKLI